MVKKGTRIRIVPGRSLIRALVAASAIVLVVLLIGVSAARATWVTIGALVGLLTVTVCDYTMSLQAWRRSSPRMIRRLPAAFAIGVPRPVQLALEHDGSQAWHCELHDHTDPSLATEGLPIRLTLGAAQRTETTYRVIPTLRGEISFAPADVRVGSRWKLCDFIDRLGSTETRRVYPDFAQVVRYAWLAGDRRLQEIGVRTYRQRGPGTDFKQLSEYAVGDSVRHIDWRATLRLGKPIIREFQEERDQCILLLLDCGRRMRADDRVGPIGTTHFDQVLNAVMLLSYVALKRGDAVGALTFGTPPGQGHSVPPRKGVHALNALMGQLYGLQPSPTHSDYVAAAQDLLQRQRKRALVIVITNFRDEDNTELGHALRLLRSRHLVLLASLRERIVDELIAQPLVSRDAAIEVASAHMYEQSRRSALHRLATRDALMVDANPERLGIELVNKYHAAKRAGLI